MKLLRRKKVSWCYFSKVQELLEIAYKNHKDFDKVGGGVFFQ